MGVVNLFMFYQGIALVRYSYFNLFTVGLYSLSVMVFTSWMSLQFRFLQETSASAMIVRALAPERFSRREKGPDTDGGALSSYLNDL